MLGYDVLSGVVLVMCDVDEYLRLFVFVVLDDGDGVEMLLLCVWVVDVILRRLVSELREDVEVLAEMKDDVEDVWKLSGEDWNVLFVFLLVDGVVMSV